MTTLERIADTFFEPPKKTDYTTYGRVDSINADGSYQVQLNASATTTRCTKLCEAAVGDSVMVVVQANGHAAAIGRVGGDNAPNPVSMTFTKNTSNVDSISVGVCKRIGKLCIFSCDGNLKTAGKGTWTDTVLGTLDVTSVGWTYALGRTNSGEVFTVQITTNSNEIVYRTLAKATTDATFRFSLVFICN